MKIHRFRVSHSVSATGPGAPTMAPRIEKLSLPAPLHHLVYRKLSFVAKVATVKPENKRRESVDASNVVLDKMTLLIHWSLVVWRLL